MSSKKLLELHKPGWLHSVEVSEKDDKTCFVTIRMLSGELLRYKISDEEFTFDKYRDEQFIRESA